MNWSEVTEPLPKWTLLSTVNFVTTKLFKIALVEATMSYSTWPPREKIVWLWLQIEEWHLGETSLSLGRTLIGIGTLKALNFVTRNIFDFVYRIRKVQ